MKTFCFVTAVFVAAVTSFAQPYKEDFSNPPQEARIRVWWHWMDSNITKDGIRKDIDWMVATGVGGFQQFDAGGAMAGGVHPIVERLPYMQEGWKDAFRYAMKYADEKGLEVAIASAPGWSSTGGPWVRPEDAMKKLTWRTMEVSGNPGEKKPRALALPEPFTTVGKFQNAGGGSALQASPADVEPWYQDVAVVAVRLPDEDKSLRDLGAEVSSSGGTFTVEMLSDGDLSDGTLLPANLSGTHSWIQYSFPEVVTVRALTLCGGPVRGQWGRNFRLMEMFSGAAPMALYGKMCAASLQEVWRNRPLTFPRRRPDISALWSKTLKWTPLMQPMDMPERLPKPRLYMNSSFIR